MLGYLYRVTNQRIEDFSDEMLAILSDRSNHTKEGTELTYRQ